MPEEDLAGVIIGGSWRLGRSFGGSLAGSLGGLDSQGLAGEAPAAVEVERAVLALHGRDLRQVLAAAEHPDPAAAADPEAGAGLADGDAEPVGDVQEGLATAESRRKALPRSQAGEETDPDHTGVVAAPGAQTRGPRKRNQRNQ